MRMNDSVCMENSVFVLVLGAGLPLRMMIMGCDLVLTVTVWNGEVGITQLQAFCLEPVTWILVLYCRE